MKPKTKFQKKVVAQSEKLEPITPEQGQWANERMFGNHFVRVRNRNNCLQCGHKWKSEHSVMADRIIKPTCPSCGAKDMEHVDGWDTDKTLYEYWAIIDVVEDFQVVRMFRHRKYMKRKKPVHYYNQEVMQHWIDQDGNLESLTAECQSLGSYYVDQWIAGTPLEIRTKSHGHEMRCGIQPYKILPGRNTLPIIRRNGYKGYFYGTAPHEFFHAILQYSEAETLLKAKQKSLFKKIVGRSVSDYDKVVRHWDSICIAMRNDYIVDDAGDWLDYLDMLDEFEKDLHNPHYICPADFHAEHQRYVKKLRAKRKAEAEADRRKRIKEAEEEYQKAKSRFFDLNVVTGEIQIVPMKSVQEVIELGDKLHHCLGLGYAKKEESLILGAFIGKEPLEAIEVNLKSLKIIQARGLQNHPTEHHDFIVDAVQQNMNKIAERAA